ncbi:hypothetical protein GY45DRAFT_366147 [Cubamyces sp. BRFM 1775]|nr:hypothetical protein GY45DRAFT_366147 [Cubamyces sp. BRFM 1775]
MDDSDSAALAISCVSLLSSALFASVRAYTHRESNRSLSPPLSSKASCPFTRALASLRYASISPAFSLPASNLRSRKPPREYERRWKAAVMTRARRLFATEGDHMRGRRPRLLSALEHWWIGTTPRQESSLPSLSFGSTSFHKGEQECVSLLESSDTRRNLNLSRQSMSAGASVRELQAL